MRLIAHRGFASLYPENTLTAIEEAVALADEIEVDVRRCDSGELVVIHDETVDRVSDGTGSVASHSLIELRELNVLGTGRGIPTLEEVLETVPPEIGINVELKEVGLAGDAIRQARRADSQVTISSFHATVIDDCRDADETVPRAFLFDSDPRRSVEIAQNLDCSFVHPSVGCCDERLVGDAHAAAMSVNAWTIDSKSDARPLAEMGVDGIIADRWGVLPEAET